MYFIHLLYNSLVLWRGDAMTLNDVGGQKPLHRLEHLQTNDPVAFLEVRRAQPALSSSAASDASKTS